MSANSFTRASIYTVWKSFLNHFLRKCIVVVRHRKCAINFLSLLRFHNTLSHDDGSVVSVQYSTQKKVAVDHAFAFVSYSVKLINSASRIPRIFIANIAAANYDTICRFDIRTFLNPFVCVLLDVFTLT